MDPTFLAPHSYLAQIYHEKALYDEAIAEFKVSDGAKRDPWKLAMIGRARALAGKTDEAQNAFKELRQFAKRHELEPQCLMPMYMALGEKDEVFALCWKKSQQCDPPA